MAEPNKFLDLFYSIQGTNLKEKTRNFNEFRQLLRSEVANENDLNNLILSITPTYPLEETFKIKLMLNFLTKELLLGELKRCNRFYVTKLLKDWKLFRKIFSEITTADLINNILPCLSYALRLKILNGIFKNVTDEKRLDEHFLAVEKKYGMDSARIVLPACSVQLVKSRIKKYELKLSPSHLKRIVKKDVEFVDFYFDAIKHKTLYVDLTKKYFAVLKWVARVNSDIYWKLQQKHKLSLKFGKRLTLKMIRCHKNITGCGIGALSQFHLSKMYKTMFKEEKLEEFLLGFYPKTHDKFVKTVLDTNVLQFIEEAPRRKRYSLISAQFTRKYNQELLDYPDYFTRELLEITPLETRERILDIKVKDNEDLHCLYGTEITIREFKHRTEVDKNFNLGMKLNYALSIFKTCLIDDDQVTLLEFLQYLIGRYKTDSNFLTYFLDKCLQDTGNLWRLNLENLDRLAEIKTVLEDYDNIWTWGFDLFYGLYVELLITNGKPIENFLKHLVKGLVDEKDYCYPFIEANKDRKMVCDKLAHCIDEYKDHEKYPNLCCTFLLYVSKLCMLKPEEIKAYERFFPQLKIEEYTYAILVENWVKLDNDIIHDLFWRLPQRYDGRKALLWYARNRPDLLEAHADKIWAIEGLGKRRIEKFVSRLKRFCDRNLFEKLKMHVLEVMNGDNFEMKEIAIVTISVLSPETFVELIPGNFPPKSGKIAEIDPPGKTNKMQRAFIKGIKNIDDSARTFPLVLKFCAGGYLKTALISLYGISYNTSELLIGENLEGLSNKAMKAKKHLLLLTKRLLPVEDFTTLLTVWSEGGKDSPMRYIVLKKTIQYFCENPTENLWVLLKRNLKSIDAEDWDIFNFVLKIQNIPLDYLTEYLDVIYETVAKDPEFSISMKRFDVIHAIPNHLIDKLKLEFLKKLIRETLCREPSQNFHWKCVLHVSDEKRSELFEENFIHFSRYVKEQTDSTRHAQVRSRISNFLVDFIRLTVELKTGFDLVNLFKSKWLMLFAPECFVRDFLLVQFYDLTVKNGFDMYETGNEINRLMYQYIDKYNGNIVNSFCRQLLEFLDMVDVCYTRKREEAFRFAEGFFREKRDENVYIGMLYLMPSSYYSTDKFYAKYLPFLGEIERCESPAVRQLFDHYFSRFRI